MNSILKQVDPEIYRICQAETRRLADHLEMIASENFVSEAVLEASGSTLTNKYAEGYPGKRYYAGCEVVDQAENLAIERAKKLFGASFVNVQPHSGSQANMGVYFSVLKPGDRILAMNLAHGGHLTHGSPVNFSGMFFDIVPYGVSKETGRIDMNEVEALALEKKPKLIIVGASAYPRHFDFAAFRAIADRVGALLMADVAHPTGLIAAKLHPDPMPHCHFVTTTTHKTLRGPRGGMILSHEEQAKGVQKLIFPGIQGGPMMHTIAAKAVAFGEALAPAFKTYAAQIIANAQALASTLMERGFVLTSGGTDNHLVLVDLHNKGVTGKEAEAMLQISGITVNKNMIPYDDQSPFITSGVRIGTAALTTRGMKETEMRRIAGWIGDVIEGRGSEAVVTRTKGSIQEMCRAFPLYAKLLENER